MQGLDAYRDQTSGMANLRATPPVIELTDLTKTYGGVRAVAGVDLRIDSGALVAMLGPNGAGKSTINELIVGLVRPDRGRAAVFGADPSAAVRAGRVGAMLQQGALLAEARVIDVLRLMSGLHAHPLGLEEVIQRADLAGFLTTKTDKLSGGQVQRLRLALALLPDPELMILDEPTVGMDVDLRRRFWRAMREFVAAGRTVLFATHYLDEADEVADRVIVLSAGRVVADGTGAEIRGRVAGRTISLAADGPDASALAALPGVVHLGRAAARWQVHTTDSDQTLRALLEHGGVHDVEITSATLEEAFVALTTPPARLERTPA